MQSERGKPPETPNAPYRAARIKDERWRSAGPGFEPGRAGLRLSLTSSQDAFKSWEACYKVHAKVATIDKGADSKQSEL
jgi:hypothetical protein